MRRDGKHEERKGRKGYEGREGGTEDDSTEDTEGCPLRGRCVLRAMVLRYGFPGEGSERCGILRGFLGKVNFTLIFDRNFVANGEYYLVSTRTIGKELTLYGNHSTRKKH